MGRPFTDELKELEETYRWALGAALADLSDQIASLAGRRLYAVGSGGSLTSAEVASTLFWQFEYGFSSAITPIELASRSATLRDSSVLITTAGGSNADVIGALRTAAYSEAARVLAVCASLNSRLAAEGERLSNVSVFDFDPPSGRDGFLAANSLLATAVLLTHGFADSARVPLRIPDTLPALVRAKTWPSHSDSLANDATHLWSRDTLVVLFGPSTRAAAVDIESKLTEAALFNCSIAMRGPIRDWTTARPGKSTTAARSTAADHHLTNPVSWSEKRGPPPSPIIPFPSSTPRYGDMLIDEYGDLFERIADPMAPTWDVDSRDIVYAHEKNPHDLYRSILNIADARDRVFEQTGGSKLVLSPLGSKAVAVGLLMAALERNFAVVSVESIAYRMKPELPEFPREDSAELVHVWLHGSAYCYDEQMQEARS